jgi:hypothetical protein
MAPFGKHLCPTCGNTSKLRYTVLYLAALISLLTGIVIISNFVAHLAFDGEVTYWLGTYIALWTLGFPVDKWFDENLRTLRQL